MFTPQIVKFEKALENMDGKIKQLARALDTVNSKLDVIAGVLRANADWQKKAGRSSRPVPKGLYRYGTPASACATSLAAPPGP
jgi:hypothetical protein